MHDRYEDTVSKLSVKFSSRALEDKFKAYAHKIGITYKDLANDLFDLSFQVKKVFSEDLKTNVQKIIYFYENIDWEAVITLHDKLRNEPLTRNLSLVDLAIAIFSEGLQSYKERYSRLSGTVDLEYRKTKPLLESRALPEREGITQNHTSSRV